MQSKTLAGIVAVIVVGVLAAGTALGGIVTVSATAPTPDGADIHALTKTGTSTDKFWSDTRALGQTFMTGGNAGGYTLDAITLQTSTVAPATKGYTFRVGSVSGTSFTEIASDTGSQGTNMAADDYITFQLNPTGSTLGSGYTVSGATLTPTGGSYGAATAFQSAAGTAGSGNLNLTLTDDSDNSCQIAVEVTDPGTCSTTFDLAVSKTAASSTVHPTTTITYTVSVQNIGTQNATGVVISDTLPLSVTFVTSSTTNGSTYTPATGAWDVGNVDAGTGVTMTLVVTANLVSGQTITNTAVLTASTQADTNTGNNSSAADVTRYIYYFPLIFKN